MRDITTTDLVRRVVAKAHLCEQAAAVYAIQSTGKNAAALKRAVRAEQLAIEALNTHLKGCVSLVARKTKKMAR